MNVKTLRHRRNEALLQAAHKQWEYHGQIGHSMYELHVPIELMELFDFLPPNCVEKAFKMWKDKSDMEAGGHVTVCMEDKINEQL